eukprot:COSAG02_NODE_1598_length_11761_cov_15.902418_9_plen_114_part_00
MDVIVSILGRQCPSASLPFAGSISAPARLHAPRVHGEESLGSGGGDREGPGLGEGGQQRAHLRQLPPRRLLPPPPHQHLPRGPLPLGHSSPWLRNFVAVDGEQVTCSRRWTPG